MEADLLTRLKADYGQGELSPIMRQHFDFGTSNRDRARRILAEIDANLGLDFAKKRVLDVGCAYAGFVIESAARGASAWGVEISPKFYEYGRLNCEGEPGDIHLIRGDVLSRQVVRQLPRDFDFVLLNDVFEHVYDTATLLAHLSQVMARGANFYFSIPNGDSVEFVAREGHYGKAGLSLLAPNRWHHVLQNYTAYYRPWSYYAALFNAFGFEQITFWGADTNISLEYAKSEVKEGVARAEVAVKECIKKYPKAATGLAAGLKNYQARVTEDLESNDVRFLCWRYLTTFWRGCAVKTAEPVDEMTAHAGREDFKAAPNPILRLLRRVRRATLRGLVRRPLLFGPAPAWNRRR